MISKSVKAKRRHQAREAIVIQDALLKKVEWDLINDSVNGWHSCDALTVQEGCERSRRRLDSSPVSLEARLPAPTPRSIAVAMPPSIRPWVTRPRCTSSGTKACSERKLSQEEFTLFFFAKLSYCKVQYPISLLV